MGAHTSQPSSRRLCNRRLRFQRIPKKRSFGKSGIFNDRIKVVVDKPLKMASKEMRREPRWAFFSPQPDLFGVTIKPSSSLSLFTRFYERE